MLGVEADGDPIDGASDDGVALGLEGGRDFEALRADGDWNCGIPVWWMTVANMIPLK